MCFIPTANKTNVKSVISCYVMSFTLDKICYNHEINVWTKILNFSLLMSEKGILKIFESIF